MKLGKERKKTGNRRQARETGQSKASAGMVQLVPREGKYVNTG